MYNICLFAKKKLQHNEKQQMLFIILGRNIIVEIVDYTDSGWIHVNIDKIQLYFNLPSSILEM